MYSHSEKTTTTTRPCYFHKIVKPGQLWKSTHALFLPKHKIENLDPGDKDRQTHVLIVHLEKRTFEDFYKMNYVEVWFLTEYQEVQRLKLVDSPPPEETEFGWLGEFYKYVERKREEEK